MPTHKRSREPFHPAKQFAQMDLNVAADFINEPVFSSRAIYGITPNPPKSFSRRQRPRKPS